MSDLGGGQLKAGPRSPPPLGWNLAVPPKFLSLLNVGLETQNLEQQQCTYPEAERLQWQLAGMVRSRLRSPPKLLLLGVDDTSGGAGGNLPPPQI